MLRRAGRTTFIAVTIAALAVIAGAQETELWVARYDSPLNFNDVATGVAPDGAGGAFVTGYSQGAAGWDYATVRYDASGNELWVRRYDGTSGEDIATGLAVDASGNVYVIGYSWGNVSSHDYATVKYDPDGNELWVRRYEGPAGTDYARGIGLDAAGNVYVTGQSWGGANYDYATVKYDPDGNELWVRRYNGPGNGTDNVYGLAVDAAGNAHVTGYCYTGAVTGHDYATVKYDTDGNELWVRYYAGAGSLSDQARAIAVDGSGNVVVTGWAVGPANLDYATVKYDAAGNELWARLYNGTGNGTDNGYALALDAAGNVYVTGESWGNVSSYDYATVKYDAAGNQQWAMRHDGSAAIDDIAVAMAVGPAGDVFVTGRTTETSTSWDYTTVKYSPAGAELWVHSYDGGTGLLGSDQARAIACSPQGAVFVTGSSSGSASGLDYATIKYGFRDLAVAGITVPDTLEPEGLLVPEVEVWSPGSQGDTGRAFFFVERPGGGFYANFDEAGFPPAGWDTANADGGLFNWLQGSAFPLTPPNYATVLREPTLAANDDWLITPRVRVAAHDTVYFWARTVDGDMESLQVWVSYTEPHPDSFKQAIQAFDFNSTTYGLYWADFHSVGDTTVYIGFRYRMPSGFVGAGICIDDVRLPGTYYAESLAVFVPAGDTVSATFPAWEAEEGRYVARCSVYVAGDVEPGNDELAQPLRVYVPPAPPSDWTEKQPMPLPPSGKPVYYGGWLTYNEADNTIYGGKGNKQQEFYRFELVSEAWTYVGQLPSGLYGGRSRPTKKGSRAVAGPDALYYTAGNNTNSFYRYHITGDTWAELEFVPDGPSRKRIKGGNDMVYIQQGAAGYVYLLKGYRNEFYRFNIASGEWEALPSVPFGRKQKYDKGSFLAWDGGGYLYAHQAKYPNPVNGHHYMFRYDMAGDTWDNDTLKGMPLLGLHGGRLRSKKSKDGGSGAWHDGKLYALKGGNTQQFYRYDPATDLWEELDTMPTVGAASRKRRVKAGAELVSTGTGAFYALKGNKTPELWYYAASDRATSADGPRRDGALAGAFDIRHPAFEIAPNPLAGARAVLRYSLPMAGAARVSVFDIAGRGVLSRGIIAGRSGSVNLDLGRLSAGVYLVKFEAAGRTLTGKLVVER